MSFKRGVRFANSCDSSGGGGGEDGLEGSHDDDHHTGLGALSDASSALKSVWFSDVDIGSGSEGSGSVSHPSRRGMPGSSRRSASRSRSRARSLSEVGSLGGLSQYFSDLEGMCEGLGELSPRSGMDSIGSGWTRLFVVEPSSPPSPLPVRAPAPLACVKHVRRRGGRGVCVGGGGVAACVNRYTEGVDAQQWQALCGATHFVLLTLSFL